MIETRMRGRRPVLALGLTSAIAASWAGAAGAASEPEYPGREWVPLEPARTAWSPHHLKLAEDDARSLGTTSVMIVEAGRALARWGDIAQPVRVASVRKSLLSALYGIAVAEGKIDLDLTLAQLGIDDKPPSLTAAEKKATIRDLLTARSGVYHEAAAETDKARDLRPPRGSHRPGTFWYYNNWDFNALGTIWRQLTGEDIFAAIDQRIARPIGMQEFTAASGKYILGRASIHPAYHMDMSARDLARFGLLFLRQGRWKGRQVVPAAWVAESTRPIADARPGVGYGYMWWAAQRDQQLSARVGVGAYSARGYGGQFLFVLPDRDLVIAVLHARHVLDREVGVLLRKIMEASPGRGRR